MVLLRPGGPYLLVLGAEARPVQLVDGHHHGHHVFTVHDGHRQHALRLELRQLVHKVAEVSALREREREREGERDLIASMCSYFPQR